MGIHFFTAIIFRGCALCGFYCLEKEKLELRVKNPEYIIFALLAIKLAVSILYASDDYYFGYDMSCFKAWSFYTYKYGLSGMYQGNFFLDYPPGYMYILRITQYVRLFLGLEYDSIGYIFLIKFTPIIADLITVFFVWHISRKYISADKAMLVTTVLAFCPMTVFNSAVWGQIDSFYTLFIILALYYISVESTLPAAIFYAVALLTKPQALLFGPVFLFAMVKRGSLKETIKALITGLGFMYRASLPFGMGVNPMWLVRLYLDTMSSYRYFTVNAYNFWAILGKNWYPLANVAGSDYINTVIIVLLIFFTGYCFIKLGRKEDVFATAFIIIEVIFTFGTMMHERYMFPAGIIALVGYVMTQRREWFFTSILSLSVSYLNISLSMDNQCAGLYLPKTIIKFTGLLCTAVCLICILLYIQRSKQGSKIELIISNPEISALVILTVCYSLVAFFRLGANTAPQTFWQSETEGEWFVYRLNEYSHISHVWTYSGMGDEYSGDRSVKKGCDFSLCLLDDEGLWQEYTDLNHKYVFTWDSKDVDIWTDCVLIRANSPNQVLNEIIFTDSDNNIIYGTMEISDGLNYGKYSPFMALDESETKPESFDSHFYSTYFDEIYFARSAYEIGKGYSVYETTHPMLGKEIIYAGIALFGMNPFGWRVMGTLAGIIMIPVMYLLAEGLLKSKKLGLYCAILLSLDFMHCTQTRIATVDSFLVLFIMLMYLFMLKYSQCNEKDIPLQMINLLMSGIFTGCAISVKWNGAFAIIGLAFSFFMVTYIRISRSFDKKKSFIRQFKICCFCIFCFIIVPSLIYFISFSPVLKGDTITRRIYDFIRWQKNMFSYHSGLVAEHPYSSAWYTWMLDKRPVWYSISRLGNKAASIASFGNPVVWLMIIPSVVIYLFNSLKSKKPEGVCVAVSYYGSMLPWAIISRVAFIYHYFPCTVPGIIAIGGCAKILIDSKNGKKLSGYIWILPVIAGLMFIVFFPVITGMSADKTYINALEIVKSWNFI